MAGLGERLYEASPVWMQQAAVALYGWYWYRERYNAHFHRLNAEYQARERWTEEQFRSYQESHLRILLTAAWKSPYYRQKFQAAGISPETPPFEALSRIPYLSKNDLRLHARHLLTEHPLPKGTVVFKSSGTTGTPTEIYYTREFHALEVAVSAVRSLNWAGVNYQARRVMFGVRKVCNYNQTRPPFWRFSPAEDMAYASIYHLSPAYLPSYMTFLLTFQPAIIMGYPSALATVARHVLDHGKGSLSSQAVITTSETLFPQQREAIEAACQCRVSDSYGAVEGCVFAAQCEHGRYHVSPEIGIVEILDQDGQACQPGEPGEVICTGLQNALQPLIRYRIGDVARWAVDQSCPCGRQMPILEGIDGRVEELCYTADGREMLRFDTVFKGVDSILEAQVVQERLDCFTIRLVPAHDFNEADSQHLIHNMQKHVGNVQVHVEQVERIERTVSGKFRAVVCNLSPAEMGKI